MVVIVMGISGSGKLTVASALADEMGCHFYNGDDFHPQPNLEKIEQGLPLSQEDRAPWIQSLRSLIEKHVELGQQAVIACHFLNRNYREQLLTQLDAVRFVYLRGDFNTLLDRIRGRKKNVEADALKRQYAQLEEADDVIVVGVEEDTEKVVENIIKKLKIASAESSS